MKKVLFLSVLLWVTMLQAQKYSWISGRPSGRRVKDISVPSGYKRVSYPSGSYQHWLQHLPLKESDPMITTYRGKVRRGQGIHYRIIDIDVGGSDLQQCADSVIRLYAEYLYSVGATGKIKFNFTSGDQVAFSRWKRGDRPVVRGNRVTWKKTGVVDGSYRSFREYLDVIFMYAGSLSLSREMGRAKRENIRPGDVFLRGGTPGHAVLVVDVAKNNRGDVIFLLAQSDTPAQDVHILHNKKDSLLTPWYSIYGGGKLRIPRYTFKWSELRRF